LVKTPHHSLAAEETVSDQLKGIYEPDAQDSYRNQTAVFQTFQGIFFTCLCEQKHYKIGFFER